MGVEIANYLNQLVATNPLGNDPKAEGDDHLRLLKQVLTQSFPNIGGAMTASHTRLNLLNAPQLCDTTSGTAPAFEIPTPQVAVASLISSQLHFVAFHAGNSSGTATLNISSLGAKDILEFDADGLLIDAIFPPAYRGILAYALGADCYILLNPTAKVVIPEYAVGDLKWSTRTSYPAGYRWILANSQTIGNASSGAAQNSAEFEDLFLHLWSTYSNSLCPIYDSAGSVSSRGASAAADWTANKRLATLDWRGLTIRGHHNGSGTYETDTTRVLGSYQADAIKSHEHLTDGSTSGNRHLVRKGADGPVDYNSVTSSGNDADYITGSKTELTGGLENIMRNRSANLFIRY